MAFNFGMSNNSTVAEQQRIEHGPFVIPFPRGKTREESPFGLQLSGNHRMDNERVQIRIAALQHGMTVLVENGGNILTPRHPGTKSRKILEISDDLDSIYARFYADKTFTTKDRPSGYVAAHWNDPAKIQERIPRKQESLMKALFTIAMYEASFQRARFGFETFRRPAKLRDDNTIVSDYLTELVSMEHDEAHGPLPGFVFDYESSGGHPSIDIGPAHDHKLFRALWPRLRAIAAEDKEITAMPLQDYGEKMVIRRVVDDVIETVQSGKRPDFRRLAREYHLYRNFVKRSSREDNVIISQTNTKNPRPHRRWAESGIRKRSLYEHSYRVWKRQRAFKLMRQPRDKLQEGLFSWDIEDLVEFFIEPRRSLYEDMARDESVIRTDFKRACREVCGEDDRWFQSMLKGDPSSGLRLKKYEYPSGIHCPPLGLVDTQELDVRLTDEQAFALIDSM
ncbi:hypothetical protein D8B26_002440 [Coccidioides posadasii str. Silveira]|uniref:Uncharacterized protein n=1 Tax=Coccidioides posadasii (strain RMSCC 757 / Silveira) TaxID=443226 RepID=E9DHH0_COCPS|nr:conserved hypothetical protein [Coccidioides posadasii str. Silveira]QVM07749.1 hypothetical protein D8B26_002440 [Coccidioides posadasii str. Silveira]